MAINEQKLFPDIEHQLKYIWEKYKRMNVSKADG